MIEEKKNSILIVDDTEINIDILLDLLSNEYDVMVALDGPSAIELAQEERPDLILLDIMMPDMDGFEVCEILKNSSDTAAIPIIFITAKTDEDSIERAYEIGGIDYVTKPFKPRELFVRVKTHINTKLLLEHLEFLASYDQMTKIFNRRKFFELAIARFNEEKKNLFAVMIDIDNFKAVNDTYGHSIGDKVIKKVTASITSLLSKRDIFGRIGGEEFALLLNADSRESVFEKIESIRALVSAQTILNDDGEKVNFTISEGMSEATEEMRNIDELLKDADKALYEAKGTGRNKVIFR